MTLTLGGKSSRLKGNAGMRNEVPVNKKKSGKNPHRVIKVTPAVNYIVREERMHVHTYHLGSIQSVHPYHLTVYSKKSRGKTCYTLQYNYEHNRDMDTQI